MSRKHNTKHNRTASKYPERLKLRGQTPTSVRMIPFDSPEARAKLRNRQGVRVHPEDSAEYLDMTAED